MSIMGRRWRRQWPWTSGGEAVAAEPQEADYLLDAGAVDRMGRIDLHYAAGEGDIGRLRELLRGGSDPNHQDDQGLTPLHFAAVHAQPDAARVLLEAGAQVDVEDSWGNHPLARAVMSSRGACELIRLLLDAGADPEHANHSGNSPLSTANLIANYDIKRCFERD
jgi:uncharacterized protein